VTCHQGSTNGRGVLGIKKPVGGSRRTESNSLKKKDNVFQKSERGQGGDKVERQKTEMPGAKNRSHPQGKRKEGKLAKGRSWSGDGRGGPVEGGSKIRSHKTAGGSLKRRAGILLK